MRDNGEVKTKKAGSRGQNTAYSSEAGTMPAALASGAAALRENVQAQGAAKPFAVERLTQYEKGVTALPHAQPRLMRTAQWIAAKNGNREAARDVVNALMTADKISEVQRQTSGEAAVFLTVPSSTGKNMLTTALAEKLAKVNGGRALESKSFLKKRTKSSMKDTPVCDRPFVKSLLLTDAIEDFKSAIGDTAVVVVEDVFTTGASAHAFVRFLREQGIRICTVVGLMGDARMTAEPQLVSKLQRTLKNADMNISGRELAAVVSRGEVQALIDRINKVTDKEARHELAARIQGILDARTAGRV